MPADVCNAFGYDVQLTGCRLDEASIQRLANHKTNPRFVILVQELDRGMTSRLSGRSVRVIKRLPE